MPQHCHRYLKTSICSIITPVYFPLRFDIDGINLVHYLWISFQNDVNPQIAPVPPTLQHIDGKVTQVGAVVQGFCGPVSNVTSAYNNSASSSTGNIDFGLWKGHEVNSEFVDFMERS